MIQRPPGILMWTGCEGRVKGKSTAEKETVTAQEAEGDLLYVKHKVQTA